MSISDAEEVASTTRRLIDESGGFWQFFGDNILGGTIFAVWARTLEGIDGAGTILFGPPTALGEGLILLIASLFDGFVGVFDAGTQATIRSFASGVLSSLGPFAQPTGLGIVLLSFGLLIWGLNRLEIDPFVFVRAIPSRLRR